MECCGSGWQGRWRGTRECAWTRLGNERARARARAGIESYCSRGEPPKAVVRQLDGGTKQDTAEAQARSDHVDRMLDPAQSVVFANGLVGESPLP